MLRDVFRRCRRGLRAVFQLTPGAVWLMAWTDPLHLARRLLHAAIAQRATYVTGVVLDLGCGSRPYGDLFRNATRYVGVDLPQNSRAHIYADAQLLPFRTEAFDTVVCTEVLEHVPEPSRLMNEVARVLKPGGHLLLTTPQTWGLHHVPHDYYRYTAYGLRYLAGSSGLEVIDVAPTCGLWATLAQRLADTAVYTGAVGWPRPAVRLLSIALAPVLLGGFLLDRAFGHQGDTLDNVLVARRDQPTNHLA